METTSLPGRTARRTVFGLCLVMLGTDVGIGIAATTISPVGAWHITVTSTEIVVDSAPPVPGEKPRRTMASNFQEQVTLTPDGHFDRPEGPCMAASCQRNLGDDLGTWTAKGRVVTLVRDPSLDQRLLLCAECVNGFNTYQTTIDHEKWKLAPDGTRFRGKRLIHVLLKNAAGFTERRTYKRKLLGTLVSTGG